MTNLYRLIKEWENSARGRLTVREYKMRMTLWDAARIAALAEMYPLRNENELISELLTAALDELISAMPYVQGNKVGEDEEGNPIYEDIGPTPRFLELTQKNMRLFGGLSNAQPNESRPH